MPHLNSQLQSVAAGDPNLNSQFSILNSQFLTPNSGDAQRRQNGFSLVELLVACTLLALVIVPILRSVNANRKVSSAIIDSTYESIASSSDAASNSEL